MNKKIICAFSLLLIFLCAFIGFCLPKQNTQRALEITPPKNTLLINDLHGRNFSMQLYYGDTLQGMVHAFDADAHNLILNDQAYSAFSGGFIETDKYQSLLDTVNAYRSRGAQKPVTDFGDYKEVEGYGFLSLSSGLQGLYVIDLTNDEVISFLDMTVSSDTMPQAQNSEGQSPESKTSVNQIPAITDGLICHIAIGKDACYVLCINPDTSTAYWYTLNKEDFSLQDSRAISLPGNISSRNQCALDNEGTAYFASSHELFIVTQQKTQHLALGFDPEQVYFENDRLYTLALSDFFLTYAVFDHALEMTDSGQANLPNKNAQLTYCTLKDGLLYTLCEDQLHPLFKNYITIYDISNHEMIYCLALKNLAHCALIDGQLQYDQQ